MTKKIYLATPVNGRKEPTLREKEIAAYNRILEMRVYLRQWYPEAEFYYVFNLLFSDTLENLPESHIMGACVEAVMKCDIIILDDGWEDSNGCNVERYVADRYGKQVYTMKRFMLKEKLEKK